MIIVGSVIVVILGIVGWFILWFLVKDPDAPFEFRGTTFHHGQDPEELLKKVRVFAYQVETVFIPDIMALLHVTNIEAEIFLDYLVSTEELEKYGEGEDALYTLV